MKRNLNSQDIKIKDLRLGQKVSIKGTISFYLGIQKVKITNLRKQTKEYSKGKTLKCLHITACRTEKKH